MRTILAGIAAGLIAFIVPAAVLAAPLRFCYEDSPEPPWTMPDGSGLALDLLRMVAVQVHEQFTLLPVPWKRCIEEVAAGEIDGAIGSADAPDRRAIGRLPTLADGRTDPDAALDADTYYVYIRSGSGASWDGRRLTIPHGAVVIPRGYHFAGDLRAQGLTVLESIKSSEEGLRTLKAGLADVAILLGVKTRELAQSPAFHDNVTIASAPWDTVPGYLLVSNPSYQQDPARFAAIWNAIRSSRHSPEYNALVESVTGHPQTWFTAPAGTAASTPAKP